MASASSLSIYRCIPPGPTDLCMSHQFKCSFTWSFFTKVSLPFSGLSHWSLWPRILESKSYQQKLKQRMHQVHCFPVFCVTRFPIPFTNGPTLFVFFLCCWNTHKSLSCYNQFLHQIELQNYFGLPNPIFAGSECVSKFLLGHLTPLLPLVNFFFIYKFCQEWLGYPCSPPVWFPACQEQTILHLGD